MRSKVWMSSIQGSAALNIRQGTRIKFYNHDWTPAEIQIPLVPEEIYQAMMRHVRGYTLERLELPEAAAVWNDKSFKRVGQIFYANGFFVVRAKLADVLSRFDLGQGGLISFPVYQSDLATPYGGDFWLLNFGSHKNSILPEKSANARKFYVDRDTGQQVWQINKTDPDGEVVLSSSALEGPDLWFEKAIDGRMFLSGRLADALGEIGMSNFFKLKECSVLT